MQLQTGPLPLYHQMEQDLRSRLHGGEFGPGDPLPTEERLCEQYGVSRITVRRALEALIAQGLIVRRRGVGSFVAERKVGSRSISLKGSLDEFLAGAGVMEPDRLSLEHDVRNAEAAAILNLPDDAGMTRLELISRIDGEPAAYLEIYFPLEVGGKLEQLDFVTAGVPIIRAVERRLNVRVARAQQRIESGVAGRVAAAHLGLRPADPVLLVTRAYYLASGQPIEVVFVRYHPARYSYVIEFHADGRAG
ncbi:GntR family transcriptional regulator [Caulobacter sp. BK020]|uniref:GntR family transcriptional regulator n=1 Tax=Caulobacter sp. BK020 TaxID=2512117 RepID=UPI0010E9F6F9|nr:GntR family transcriptional regulator [Caulobacter sp. BK020]TCS08107.1 GntR family transcriptional regulator [Caulobacter sp. BK020]